MHLLRLKRTSVFFCWCLIVNLWASETSHAIGETEKEVIGIISSALKTDVDSLSELPKDWSDDKRNTVIAQINRYEQTLYPIRSLQALNNEILQHLLETIESPYANFDTIFERIIGLGHFCTTKGQINKYFAPSVTEMNTKKGHADLFDWLFIDDYKALSAALNNKLEDFFERKDFRILDRKTIGNTKYHMRWNHLFHRSAIGADAKVSEKEGVTCEDDLDQVFPLIKEKISYLRSKLISAKEQKTLYVISHPGKGPSLETLVMLRDSLTVIRDGDRNFCLLYMPHLKTYDGLENIIVREAINLTGSWLGADSVRWKQVLDEFKFSKNIWE